MPASKAAKAAKTTKASQGTAKGGAKERKKPGAATKARASAKAATPKRAAARGASAPGKNGAKKGTTSKSTKKAAPAKGATKATKATKATAPSSNKRSTTSPNKTPTTKKPTTVTDTKPVPKPAAKPAAKKVASGPPISGKTLEKLVARLEEERETYTRQAEDLAAEAEALMADREPGDTQFDEESGEGDTINVERERDLALSASARQAVEEIDEAIARVEAGTYGNCLRCGNRIPIARLEAVPQAALCIECKSKQERRR